MRVQRLCLGAAFALSLTLIPTAAASGAEEHGGWNAEGCVPAPAHPRPVVLVHGTGANGWDNWLGLAPYLVDRGWCVYSEDFGELPGVPLFAGLGPIEESAGELAAFVDEV